MKFKSLSMGKVFSFSAAFTFVFSSGAVVAAEWSVEPSISLREEYNDNIRFTALPHPGVWQSSLTPSVKLSSKTEVSEVSGSAQLSLNRYAGDPQVENRTNKFFTFLTLLRSERNTWSMNAAYTEDSTSETEQVTTGVVAQVRTQRSLLSLSPSWTRTLTEKASLKLDYSYQEVKYDEHTNRNDYTSQRAGGTLQYSLSERDTVGLSANYSITEYSPTIFSYPASIDIDFGFIVLPVSFGGSHTTATKSSMRGLQASGSHLFSETLRGSLSLGWRRIDTVTTHVCEGEIGRVFPLVNSISCSGVVGDPMVTFNNVAVGNGSSFSANLEKTFESAKVSGFASRETNPSGSGLVETDKFGVSLNRTITENLSGSFDAVTYRTKYIGVASPGSKYFTVEPKLNWRLTESWASNAGYRYARYEPEGSANSITANAVYLNLSYNWPKMAISR